MFSDLWPFNNSYKDWLAIRKCYDLFETILSGVQVPAQRRETLLPLLMTDELLPLMCELPACQSCWTVCLSIIYFMSSCNYFVKQTSYLWSSYLLVKWNRQTCLSNRYNGLNRLNCFGPWTNCFTDQSITDASINKQILYRTLQTDHVALVHAFEQKHKSKHYTSTLHNFYINVLRKKL